MTQLAEPAGSASTSLPTIGHWIGGRHVQGLADEVLDQIHAGSEQRLGFGVGSRRARGRAHPGHQRIAAGVKLTFDTHEDRRRFSRDGEPPLTQTMIVRDARRGVNGRDCKGDAYSRNRARSAGVGTMQTSRRPNQR